MTITNGGFEEGSGGVATGWTYSAVGTLINYALFDADPVDVGHETFDWLADLIAAYEGLLVDIDPAVFEVGPGQELYEDFEEEWGATSLITTLADEAAQFDTGTPEGFEDFEEEWGDIIWTWGVVLDVSEVTKASFSSYLGTVSYDAFNWVSAVNTDFTNWIAGAELTAATFDNTGGGGGAADEYEPFDDTAFTTLTL
jgi:hypothetical protein